MVFRRALSNLSVLNIVNQTWLVICSRFWRILTVSLRSHFKELTRVENLHIAARHNFPQATKDETAFCCWRSKSIVCPVMGENGTWITWHCLIAYMCQSMLWIPEQMIMPGNAPLKHFSEMLLNGLQDTFGSSKSFPKTLQDSPKWAICPETAFPAHHKNNHTGE